MGAETGDKPKSAFTGLVIRAGAALVLIPLVVGLAYVGGPWFGGFLLVLGALMAFEWIKLVFPGVGADGLLLQLVIYLAGVLAAVLAPYGSGPVLPLAIIAVAVIASQVCWWKFGTAETVGKRWRVIGVAYIALPIWVLSALRVDEERGFWVILLVFVTVWSADTLAYFAGRTFGGPKLMPSVSPNKTWSGFFGAMAGAAAAAVCLFFFKGLPGVFTILILGAAIGAVEQGGDLIESAAKRRFGVKDSGAIIPGHGGVLDRVDGLMAAAVFAFIVGAWRGGFDNAAAGILDW